MRLLVGKGRGRWFLLPRLKSPGQGSPGVATMLSEYSACCKSGNMEMITSPVYTDSPTQITDLLLSDYPQSPNGARECCHVSCNVTLSAHVSRDFSYKSPISAGTAGVFQLNCQSVFMSSSQFISMISSVGGNRRQSSPRASRHLSSSNATF